MNIPEPFLRIISSEYTGFSFTLSKDLRNYYNKCFKDLIKELKITDFQARAIKTGKMFEYALWFLMKNRFGLDMVDGITIKKACMQGAGKLDFGIFKSNENHNPDNLLCGIEVKGSDPNSSERPGLKRTDTIKKAISQAYQFKRVYPNIPFFIVSNVMPTAGNAKCIMNLAEGDLVEKFVDATDIDDVKKFVKLINNLT